MPLEPSLTTVVSPYNITIRSRISDYFSLAKPGIVFSVLLTTLVGFILGSQEQNIAMNGILLFHTLLGTMLVAVGASSLNMLLEIDTDSLM